MQWLPQAEWCFNTFFHTSTRFTLCEVVYGYPRPHITLYEESSARTDSVEESLLDRDKILVVLKSNLGMAQNRMKVQANKKISERQFEISDWVYLRLVPYQLQYLALMVSPLPITIFGSSPLS